jgi:hypothetical protein
MCRHLRPKTGMSVNCTWPPSPPMWIRMRSPTRCPRTQMSNMLSPTTSPGSLAVRATFR